MHRRTFLKHAASTAAICALPDLCVAARKAELQVTPLTDRLLLIAGGGGNVVVFNSPDGVLMVDGGAPEHSAQILKLVKKHTGSSRVHTLINTHWHWEQTGSNRTLGPAGTRIIAHENTRLWLSTEVHCKWQDRRYEPLPQQARPSETFYTTGSLSFGGERIDYGYLLQAHTDSDIYVFFRNANVLVAGDVLSVGAYPILDYSTNGWIGGMADATRTLAGLCDAHTRIVPGAGPVQSKADLEAEHEMLKTLKERMSQLLAQGMSVQDMIAAAPTKEFDATWGDPGLFIANVWHGLVPRARELGVSIV
jgi:cyclase